MLRNNISFINSFARDCSNELIIKRLLDAYFIELGERKAKPKRMAIYLSNYKILLWAEIKDDDEVTEDALILSAAKVNFDFSKYSLYIASTIVEESDLQDIPNHFLEVELT